MNLLGIMVVKNEADIIEHTLRSASDWCDTIFVLDNGSDDGTWEIIEQVAQASPSEIIARRSSEPFTDGIRSRLFRENYDRARTGDWWCRLDADEIYPQSPRLFLESIKNYDVVWAIHLQHYFTDIDLTRYNSDPSLYDAARRPEDRLRYYIANASETRFFRHRVGLRWHPTDAWPKHLGLVFPKRILVHHFQYRSPSQMQLRFQTRSSEIFPHWRCSDWRSLIRNSDELNYDAGEGQFVIDTSILPNHKDNIARVLAKRLMHGLGIWP